ncbi:hypothetical protein DU972_003891 [Vibrio mimicus]|uniref:hypothetical protein n=1 Tax=Vibrio floridensis TaxID=2908007 RepID=UPI001A1C6713|nr:hypothetical protein [Vibrio floridensis]MCF8781154.1 hypothetical protein [Vibrio floridensis]HAS6350161.1 hypothetical protein [Vibrio vulnificus]
MKEVNPQFKSWLEVIEKSLLIISTSIAILTAAYKGAELLTSKNEQVKAVTNEVVERTKAVNLLTVTYSDLLSQLDKDIKELDSKMGDEVWKDSIGWEKFEAIRQAKVNDRNALLQSLGGQVVQLKIAEK